MTRIVVLCAVLAIPSGLAAQAPAAAPPAPAPQAGAPAAPSSPALEPLGYTYDPEGRRDPFVSLIRRGAELSGPAGARPEGLPGLTTSEVVLRGTVKGRDGFVAMLQGIDNKTYLVRPGDTLLDGTIRTITPDAVVILQKVNDPLSLETEREVRKELRQTEGAN